ncbi:MAG: YbaB/EbfC family nucleoid-associated protein [Candidatus Doudnabacteria bacterium]
MFDSLKNLNQLRQQAKKIKEELGKEVLIGTAEDGKIQITMDGNQEVKAVRIEPDLLISENKEKIEKGIKEAITQCITQMQMAMARKMQNGGLF